MGIPAVVALLRLSRIRSSMVAFLTMFVPTYVDGQDTGRSIALSIPILIISACTFMLNDLNDLESDRVNHPERPLPLGEISPRAAAITYLMTFAAALITIVLLVDASLRHLYFVILLLAVNYNAVVDYFPKLKTIYVASVITLGLVLVSQVTGSKFHVSLLATAFFFILGRELLMDVQDLRGDGSTLARWLSPRTATLTAFGLQAISVFILVSMANAALESAAASIIAILLLVVVWGWQNEGRRKPLLQLMQIQMLAGIAFLL